MTTLLWANYITKLHHCANQRVWFMRAGQKRTKWKRSWSAIVRNDNLGRRLSGFWWYGFPSQFLVGPRQPVIVPFHSLLNQTCENLGCLCCQLQKEKLGQQLLQREKTLLSEGVSCLFVPLPLAVMWKLPALCIQCILSMAELAQALVFFLAVKKLHFIQKPMRQLKKSSSISVPAQWDVNAFNTGNSLKCLSSCNLLLSKIHLKSFRQGF